MAGIEVRVTYRNQQVTVRVLQDSSTLQQLSEALVKECDVDYEAQKLLVGGRIIFPAQTPHKTLTEAGIGAGARILLLRQPKQEELAKLDVPDQRIRGFEEELASASRRRSHARSAQAPGGKYTFRGYEAWHEPGLHPPPSEALKLLHSLAADRGIAAVMAHHRWSVGKLSEMPPEGEVGVSPVCILGVNINAGQEISLRLRTDDLRGFRRYGRIQETLIHELAHMVFSEHDNSFKELNSQLLREAAAHDWAQTARALAGEDASFHGDWQNEPSSAAVTPISHRLGGLAASDNDVRAAAAQAALERAQAASFMPSVAEVPTDSAAGGNPQQASIDSLGPMDGSSAGDGQQQDAIEGLGHLDGTTEELETAMRELGTPTASHPKSSPFTMQQPGASSDSNASSEDTHPMSSSTGKRDRQPAQHLADSMLAGSAEEARQHGPDQHAEQAGRLASSSAGEESEEHMEQDGEQHGEQEAQEGSSAVLDPDLPAAAQEAVQRVLSAAGSADARAVLQRVSKILQHIVEEPDEAKFRRLRLKPLERRLGALLPHCVALLEAAGFEELSMDTETALVLWHSNLGALRSVLGFVQHQHDAIGRFGAASA